MPPDKPAQDRHQPGKIVACDGEGEQRVAGCGVDEAQQADYNCNCDDAPNHADGLVADASADMAEERGEGEGAVARKGPALARGSDNLED